MRIWKLPDQVVRLMILVVIAVVALIVVRRQFVPPTFGLEGHYRSAAVQQIAEQKISYAGQQACVECHEEHGELKDNAYHRMLSCEVCHGAAAAHAEDPDTYQPVIPPRRSACLGCHSYLPSRPTGFPQVIEVSHSPVEPCIDCHDPHDPTPPEVPGACSACHRRIARTKAISHHASLECETCHETVPEHMQSPRLHPPKKPAERAVCGQCHANGASSASRIPRIDLSTHGGRYLCWQCHYPHFPEGR